ncbi:MAG: hypothetical protein R3C32_05290 [Chloroflexota bacterium]
MAILASSRLDHVIAQSEVDIASRSTPRRGRLAILPGGRHHRRRSWWGRLVLSGWQVSISRWDPATGRGGRAGRAGGGTIVDIVDR